MVASSPEPAGNLLAEITRCADRLARIADLTNSLFSTCEADTVFREVATAVVSLRPDVVCAARLVDRAAGGYRLARVEGAAPGGLAAVVPFGRGLVHRVGETRAPLLVGNLIEDQGAVNQDWHRSHATGGFYGVPIEAGGELIGVLSVTFPPEAPLTAEERELVDLFAEQAGLAIQSGQPLLHPPGPQGALAALADVGRMMASAPDIAAAAARLVESVRGLLHAQAAVLYHVGPGELQPLGMAGSAEAPRGGRTILAAGRAVAECALREGKPVTTEDLLSDPRVTLAREVAARLRGASCRAALGVPLMVGERSLGALVVLDRRATRFPGEEVHLAQTFADVAALSLENRRLADHVDGRSRASHVLSQAAQAMTTAEDPGTALAAVARAALDLTAADVAAIALWDAEAAVFRLRCRVGSLPGQRPLPIERGTAPGAEVVPPEPLVGPEGAAYRAGGPRVVTVVAQGLSTLMAPVPGPGGPAGLVYVARRTAHGVSEAEETGLVHLAEMAALAERHADLAAREARARADRDMADERVRDLLESLNTIVWEVGPSAAAAPGSRPFSSVTRRVEGMLGYPVDAWLTQPGFWARILHPEDREGVVAACRAALDEGRSWEVDYRVIAADGRTVWIHEVGRVVRAADGGVARQHGIMVDITGRKGVEEERALLISAMEQASDAIMITTADGAIAYVNPAFRRLTGYSLSEAVGHTPPLLRSGRERPSFHDELWDTLRAGEVWRGEALTRRKDGSLFTAQQSIAPLRDERGRITHFVSIAQDITRRRELESQLLQSQKMEAVGQLASGIAHDFNNLLTVILGRGDFVRDRLPPDDPLRREVELVLTTAERAGALTNQLLTFSRKHVLQPEVLDLNALVGGMGAMLQRLIGEDIDLRLLLDPHLGRVKGGAAQVEQVVMNLAVNARDAMPRGGRLVLETANVVAGPAGLAAAPQLPPGSYVMLRVRDTGDGMTPEVRARIFEPFFTTKERGRGTGLGLSTVYAIVQQHHGHIVVESEPGHGTAFTLYLPRVTDDARPAEARPAVTAPAGTASTILLAEDDAALRAVVREMLIGHGYGVLEARDGEEALALIEAHAAGLGLLLTDVVMPKVSGPELAGELRRVRPDVPVLYMSGYPDRAGAQEVEAVSVLAKPFTPQDLLRKVREVLGAGGATAARHPAARGAPRKDTGR